MHYTEEVRDLFSVPDDYYLVHCISSDFAMGKGIAVEFDKRFDMKFILETKYPDYMKHYFYYRIGGDCILEGRVLNLVTKYRYFHKPTIHTMIIALEKMKKICIENGITKVAMPTIGAGLDKLRWSIVSEQIQNIFSDLDIEIVVCKLK